MIGGDAPMRAEGAGASAPDLVRCATAVAPERGADLLLGQLTGHLETLDRRLTGDYEHDAPLWESLLAELGRFENREIFRLLAGRPGFEELRDAYSSRFRRYARARDLARSGRVRAAQATRRGIDGLSTSIHEFLEHEEAALRSLMAGGAGSGDLVVVGCGASPETFLYYARRNADRFVRLVAIEMDPRAAALADRTLRASGLGNAEVELVDGAEFDYARAAVIHVANYVHGKGAILAAVARSASPRAVAILRQPELLETLICEQATDASLAPFRVLARVPAHYCQMTSLLLRRAT